MMMKQMQKTDRDGENTGGKAFRRVHAIRRRCEEQPEKVVSAYLDEVMDRLGAEPGDLWQPWMMTRQIHWGNMAGLHRVHFHLSHILALSLRGLHSQAEAYNVQLLRALRQAALDGCAWTTTALLLPKQDPLYKQACGVMRGKLEVIAACTEAMKKSERAAPACVSDKDKKAKGRGKGDQDSGNV